MSSDTRTWRYVLTVTLVVGLLSAGIAVKAKPPKGDPVPPAPGTILFEQVYNPGEATYYYEGWSMEGDGSGKKRTLPPEFFDGIVNEAQGLTPSESVYGDDPLFDRWWLGAKALGPDPITGGNVYELVARRPVDIGDDTLGVIEVQVTDFRSEIRVGLGGGHRPEWSNDGEDTFVSFKGIDIEWTNGVASLLATRLYGLNISWADIDAAAAAGVDLLIGPENLLLESVVSIVNGYEGNFTEHHWDPTGTKVIYSLLNLNQDPDDTSGQEDVYLTEFDENGTEISTELFWNSISSHGVGNVRWSPNGARIAVTDFGDVWTVNPDDPSDFTVVVNGSSSTLPCRNAYWSPDSLELVYNEERYFNKKGGTWEYQIYRLPADGGEPINLSGGLDKNQRNSIFGWVPLPELP